ncbi:hypothetical protein BS50DRAFT_635835 [Corynespora cassiicola Philippines]|uniref:Extracellular membrane protein CFEM domain-containing protein n=1 Tax=Corynespora cassiicola Philippines TaxID=1448308 RepID=A0A2T2NHV0_CORCC|nr:hypothetical protein BS50DRAFT_635835 [Corynespora cassiicola Philippines]
MRSALASFVLLVLLRSSFAQVTDPATLRASIKEDKNYSLLPGCINQCIWDIGDNDTPDIGGDIAIHLSCSSPWPNGCYCRPQSAAFAHSFITSCASYLCSTPTPEDINSGTSVYASYCSQALGAAYTPEGIEQVAPTGTPVSEPSSAAGAAATSRPTSGMPRATASTALSNSNPTGSPTGSASTSSSDDGKIAGLSKGAFIGVVISASCSVLGLIFGIGFKIYKHKKQNKPQQHMGANGYYYTTK